MGEGGVDSRARAGMTSLQEAGGGLAGRTVELGFLGWGDFTALAITPGDMKYAGSASGAAAGMAGWVGRLGEVRGVTGIHAKAFIAEIRRH